MQRREVGIVAQDPGVLHGGRILRSQVSVPYEHLDAGPRGARVQVFDYDATAHRRYRPPPASWIADPERLHQASDDELLGNPFFHAWNAYGIVMRTLGRFEHALGRRVAWSCLGHQLWVAPHAFADANAFYAEDEGALYFGYVAGTSSSPPMYTSLSHDVVAHETSHALLDGLRARYKDPSSPEQAAFHEGFSDIVALLSVLSSRDVVDALLARATSAIWRKDRIARRELRLDKLEHSPLFGLAEQLNAAIGRSGPLRVSVRLAPAPDLLQRMLARGDRPHDLGELPVAAMMRAYVRIWHHRLERLADTQTGPLSRARIVEEAAELADRLLTVAIRAIDYLPVVDVRFTDFVQAMVTADQQVYPDDQRYQIRTHVPESFREYGVHADDGQALGAWERPGAIPLARDGLHHGPLQTDPTECFQFLWDNRRAFEIDDDSFVRVQSVRPANRRGDDGAFVRETVIEYIEYLELRAHELASHGLQKPVAMPSDRSVTLYGGGALILDEFGQVKFHVKSSLFSEKQSGRLQNLWEAGRFRREPPVRARPRAFARMHLERAFGAKP